MQKSTKEDLNFIARFFRRFVDAIKKVFGGNKKYQQYVYDAEKLLGVFERAIKDYDSKKNRSDGVETRNAVVESVKSDTGIVYKDAVLLDTDIFSGVPFKKRPKVFKDYIYNNFAGKKITVKNDDGDTKVIEFARSNERVKKIGAKNPHKVIDELATKRDRNSQLAAIHADEIVYVSKTDDLNPARSDNEHQWLDYNGWVYRTATLVLPSGEMLEANLNIAKTKDGRNILYDINKIKTIRRASLPVSELRKNAKQNGLHTIPDGEDSISQDNPIVNTKSALSSKTAATSASAGENSVFDDKHRKDVIRKLSAVAKQNGVARLDKDSFVTDAMGILEGALDTGIVSDGVVELILTFMF